MLRCYAVTVVLRIFTGRQKATACGDRLRPKMASWSNPPHVTVGFNLHRSRCNYTSRTEVDMATQVHTTRPISERLADLSQRAKAAEDAFDAARTETKQKLDARIDQARTSVEQFKQRVQQDASSATEESKAQWQDLQGRIAKRVDKIKADFNTQKQQFAADRAVVRADWAEDEAAAAIADASGAVEYAR